jgi:hypothetical protein
MTPPYASFVTGARRKLCCRLRPYRDLGNDSQQPGWFSGVCRGSSSLKAMKVLQMITLKIHHRTVYQYREQVWLSAHRLMLRPREGRDLRLLSHETITAPEAQLRWSTDVFGNSVAHGRRDDRQQLQLELKHRYACPQPLHSGER